MSDRTYTVRYDSAARGFIVALSMGLDKLPFSVWRDLNRYTKISYTENGSYTMHLFGGVLIASPGEYLEHVEKILHGALFRRVDKEQDVAL